MTSKDLCRITRGKREILEMVRQEGISIVKTRKIGMKIVIKEAGVEEDTEEEEATEGVSVVAEKDLIEIVNTVTTSKRIKMTNGQVKLINGMNHKLRVEMLGMLQITTKRMHGLLMNKKMRLRVTRQIKIQRRQNWLQ